MQKTMSTDLKHASQYIINVSAKPNINAGFLVVKQWNAHGSDTREDDGIFGLTLTENTAELRHWEKPRQ